MSFQSAANTIVSAPGHFKFQKNLVQQLQRDLEGEQATNLAYQQATQLSKQYATGVKPNAEQEKQFKETLNQIPAKNRQMFTESINSLDAMSETIRDLRNTALNQADRITNAYDAIIAHKSISRALFDKSSAELRAKATDPNNIIAQGVKAAKEELKNGKTQTTR